jgi:Leu/Phe-tRNA-protein transferase
VAADRVIELARSALDAGRRRSWRRRKEQAAEIKSGCSRKEREEEEEKANSSIKRGERSIFASFHAGGRAHIFEREAEWKGVKRATAVSGTFLEGTMLI